MPEKGYQIGPVLADKIVATVRRVDATPYSYGVRSKREPRLEADGGNSGPRLRIGKTSAEWPKNTLATIELWESGDPPDETLTTPTQQIADVVNKWGDVAADKWVGIEMAANGHYYLVVAEC